MEAHTHRLYQRTRTGIQALGGNHLLPGQHKQFAHRTPTLHTQCFIVFASVHPAVTTRSAFATVGIGIHGHNHTGFQHLGHVLTHADNLGTHLMTGHYGHLHHRVTTAEGIQVASAETHISHFQQHFTVAHLGLGHLNHLHHRRLTNLNCFHRMILQFDN